MSDTTFVNDITLTDANWFNDVNDTVYDLLGDGINAPTTAAQIISNLGITSVLPSGIMLPYAGAAAPSGWLSCDGSAINRTTYAALFTAIGTVWGVGDGSITFNIPDLRGRSPIGVGTGVTTESCTASSSNGFTTVANNTKWITGQAVVLSALTGYTTTATAGPTYYITRISSTNVRLATTLALAQAGTPDITISGSGTVTITYTMTARTLGENGGEEAHAMSSTELLLHDHLFRFGGAGGGAPTGATGTNTNTVSTSQSGGNAAMNIRTPFQVALYIIKT